jgi:hypothetical protein
MCLDWRMCRPILSSSERANSLQLRTDALLAGNGVVRVVRAATQSARFFLQMAHAWSEVAERRKTAHTGQPNEKRKNVAQAGKLVDAEFAGATGRILDIIAE